VKKFILFSFVFIAVFVTVYIALCYSPWFALKLSAPPFEYFMASVKKLWHTKAAIGGVFGMTVGGFVTYKYR